MPQASPVPGKNLLSPNDHTLIMIDFQPQMAFATKSIDAIELRNNAGLVAAAAKEFTVSTILTSVAATTFAGPMFNEITDVFNNKEIIDRSSMNTWEDQRITEKVNSLQKNKIVLCGLWTSVCIVGPALSAADQGFSVYFIADACGDVSNEAHNLACQRMIHAGCTPMTSLQYLLELQRDWARSETYNQTMENAKKYGGAYGLGVIYAKTMFGGHEQ
jgi:nicotinamidase-related amidase